MIEHRPPSAKAAWKETYRAQRVAYRIFDRFRDRFRGADGELRLPSFFPFGFDPCRLHGDGIGFRSEVGRSWSGLKLLHLRPRVKLPE